MRIAQMGFLLVALWGVNFALTSSGNLPTGDRALWFHGGLLVLIIGLCWVEAFFTKPADVVINSLVAYISASTLTNPPLGEWWDALRIASGVLFVVSLAIIWLGGPVRSESQLPPWKRFAYHLVTRLGSSRVLFSAVFVLALLSFHDMASPEARVLVGFWLVILVLDAMDLDVLLSHAWSRATRGKVRVVGTLSRFFEPSVARFALEPGAVCRRGTLVSFTRAGRPSDRDPIAVVVGQRTTAEGVELEAVVLDSEFPAGTETAHSVVIAGLDGVTAYDARMKAGALQRAQDVIGLARRDSTIARLSFEVFGSPDVEEGRLVSVEHRRGGQVLYQVVNGCLHEEVTLEHGERTFTVGEAEQLGNWSRERQGFESFGWVAPENAPVVLHQAGSGFEKVVTAHLVDVGHVPASPYPTNVKLEELVLFHSAILGVTGSGKSFLGFYLIEKCAEAGIKVICLDITGDYKRFLHDAVLINQPSHIAQFLESSTSRIGIIEFREPNRSPIAATEVISKTVLEWCKTKRTETEIGEPKPRVLLVMEEAHALIPEWNSNPSPNLRDTVNSTAQVFLQARKYGLGVMVITQRTANVVKSVLNQCNTIFAFQAYDETGFEFMRNYMGDHFVRALPTLKKRHGVIVGKASASDKPVITRFLDQERSPRTGDASVFVPPPAVTNPEASA